VPEKQKSEAEVPPDNSKPAPVTSSFQASETDKPEEQGAAPPASAAAAPAASSKKELQIVTAKAAPPPPTIAAPADRAFKQELSIKKTIKVQKGDTIHSLARKYYQTDNRSIIDLLLQANPQIKDAGIIKPNERFTLPDITASSLILQYGKSDYKIHLATYANPAAAYAYQKEPVLKDLKIEVIPYTMAPRGGFYRIVAGPVKSRSQCLNLIAQLRKKKLLPALAPAAKAP
jgi:phage tail protein X